jgi:hypothetical protein
LARHPWKITCRWLNWGWKNITSARRSNMQRTVS